MAQVRSWAGLDVHARRCVAVTVDRRVRASCASRRLSGETSEVVAFCAALPGPARVAYEAGPTGFGLARALQAAGVGCVVAAPGKIERPAQDRVKTDRRDAERLRAAVDGRRAARGPGPERRGGGAARPGPRARGRARRSDARAARLEQAAAAPRRPLRRHRRRVDGRATATGSAAVELGERGAQVDAAGLPRRDRRADRAPRRARGDDRRAGPRLAVGADRSPGCAACAASTRSRRSGCAPRSATSSASQRAGQLMSYLGLVPSEDTQRRDAPPGRDHQDRLAARAAAAGRGRLALPPPHRRRGKRSQRRQAGQPAHVIAISWQAQQRLHRTWRRLDTERGKRRTIVAVAVARELAGFCWAIASAD